MIQGLIALTHPSYNPQPWHGIMLFWAVLICACFLNTVASSLLPKFESLILILHIVGFFAILYPLIFLGDHNSPSEVFTTFSNQGHWATQGLSFCVGLLGNVYAFLGADAAVHMSEEIHNAAVVVPRTLILSIAINGTLGLAMTIAILFSATDLPDALQSPTGYPFMAIFYQSTRSTWGTAAMSATIATLALCACVGLLASSSRLLWSFARDRAVPGWRYLAKVSLLST